MKKQKYARIVNDYSVSLDTPPLIGMIFKSQLADRQAYRL